MFKSKSEKEKLMTKALKSIGMALTVSSILVGCAKELPEKEPDAIKDNTISVSETANAMIIVETVEEDNSIQGIEGIEAQGQSKGISALSTSKMFAVKIVESNNEQMNNYLTDLKIEANQAGDQFEITFKITDGFLVAFAKPLNSEINAFSLEAKDLLPQNASNMSKLPLFQYEIAEFGIKQRVKNDLDEETRNIEFKETEKDVATHIKVSPISVNRTMTGIAGLEEDERKSVFLKERIEDEIWTVKRARNLLQDPASLRTSNQYTKYLFKDSDLVRLAVYGDSLYVKRPITANELSQIEVNLLNSDKEKSRIQKCDETFAKTLELATNDCYLRAEFAKSIEHVIPLYERDQKDSSILAKIKLEKTANFLNSKLIKVTKEGKIAQLEPVKDAKEKIFKIADIENLKVTVLTEEKLEESVLTRDGAPGNIADGISLFKAKALDIQNNPLAKYIEEIDIPAKKSGEKIDLVFKKSDGAVIGYVKKGNIESSPLLSPATENLIPVITIEIVSYGEELIAGTDNATGEKIKTYTKTGKLSATHIELGKTIGEAGLFAESAETIKSLFDKNEINGKIFTVKEVRALLANYYALRKSELYTEHNFQDDEKVLVRIFGEDLTVKRAITNKDLTDSERILLASGTGIRFIEKCSDEHAKAIGVSAGSCYLRSEVTAKVRHIDIVSKRDKTDDTILSGTQMRVISGYNNSKYIKIEEATKVNVAGIRVNPDNLFEIEEIENLRATLVTTTQKNSEHLSRPGVKKGLNLASEVKVFNTEIKKSNDPRLKYMLDEVDLVADKSGDEFYVSFKQTRNKIVAYIKGMNGTKVVTKHLPEKFEDAKKVPAFEFDVKAYGNKIYLGKDEATGEKRHYFEGSDVDVATHIILSPDPLIQGAGITDTVASIAQSLFIKQNLESETYNVIELRALLGLKDSELVESVHSGAHKFQSSDAFKVGIQDNQMVLSRFITESELNERERKFLNKGSINRFVQKCSIDQESLDSINKSFKRSGDKKLTTENCYLRSEYQTKIYHAALEQDKDLRDGSETASTSVVYKNVDPDKSKYISIESRNELVETQFVDDAGTWLKISKFKDGEFMMRRVLEDSPNVFNYTFAGSAGGWTVEMVKFEFTEDTVFVRKSKPTLSKTGTTEVDKEIIMSFPAKYIKVTNYDDDGNRLSIPKTEYTNFLDSQAYAVVDLGDNRAPRISSAIDLYGLSMCFAGEEPQSKEAIDITQEADGMNDLLSYTMKNTYIGSPMVDCAGVRYSDLAHRTLTFKERVSFKRYYGGDENPPLAIPYDLQKKFNFGIFTGEKTVPKGYSEQINSFDSTVSLPMVYDIRNGKTITYVLAGIPAANGETGRVLTKAEKDLRKKLISSSKRVVKDINKGFEKAFKGTPYEGRGEIIKLKIERDDSMPAGIRQFKGLEVVEKGHIGDMNRNYIYWIEKGTSLGIIGLGGPHSNPRNGFVESASVYLYGGNMKSSIDWMVDQAKSEKKYLDNMNASRRLVYYKDQAPQADSTPADNGNADTDGAANAQDTTETDTQAADAAANNAADARAFAEAFKTMSQEEIMSHLSHDSGAIQAISDMKSKINRGDNPFNVIQDTLKVDVNSSQFKDAIRDLHEVSKEGYGIKTPTEELDLEKMFKSEKALDKTLKMLSIHNHFKKHFPETDELNAKSVIANDRDVELAEIIHGKDSKEANAERILAKLNWTKRDGKSDLKNPICVHRKSEYVLSKLAQTYDVVEKAKTDEGKNDILIDIWMPTLAHEIGHNLGLRHNFIGSFDKKNWRFISGDENATRTSSSIMDYQTDDHITYDGLGPYDVYALRAAYTGYIPLEKLADAPSESVSVAGATLPVRNAEHKTAAGTKYEQLVKITDVIDAIGKENIKNISRDDIKRFGLKKIKFCTDEDAGESPQCNRHDAGASFQEIVDNTIHDYRKLYDFIYFPGKRKDFYLGGPIGWLLGKFMKLRQLNEELWFQFIYERDNYTEEEWNVLITDMIGAVETSLDFLRSVVTMPEAPSYVSGPNKAERFIPTGITYEKNVAGVPIKKNEVIMVETKWTEGRTFDSQDFRAMFRGTEYDKVAAIMALTADRSNSYRYLKHSLRIPYTLLEKFIFRRESYDSLVLKTLQEVLLDDVTPKVLVDHNLYSPEKAPDYTLVELDKKMFKSEVNEFIRNYAIFGAMYFLNIQTYEPSFNPSRAFRIEGKNEDELKVINPETGALENFVQIIGGDQVFVPYADDSYMASELIAKGDILRDISELETMLQSKKELYDQIGPFLQNAPASPDYDQAQMDELTAAVPTLIAEGKRNELINTYVALVQLHKNRLTQGSPEEQAKAEAFLKELTADKFANDLFRKDYAELISKVGFDPKEVSIEVLEGAALRNAFDKIAVAEKCKADKSTCPSALKNTLQGVKSSRHNTMIEEYTKNELNSWGVATIANNRVNLAELVFSSVLANIDLGDKIGNPAFNAYAPTRSASSSHDRIKGNVSELSNIFFMLNPQENR